MSAIEGDEHSIWGTNPGGIQAFSLRLSPQRRTTPPVTRSALFITNLKDSQPGFPWYRRLRSSTSR